MAPAEKTYSQKRLEDPFTLFVLLTEPLVIEVRDLVQAMAEDYPSVRMPAGKLIGQETIHSSGVGMAYFDPCEKAPSAMIMASPRPISGDIDWAMVLQKSRLVFPDAAEVVKRHQSRLSITVHATGTSLAERFEAARLLTCIGAVLARLPICTGLYFPSADMILPPKSWIHAAQEAVAERLPVLQWVNIQIAHLPDGQKPVPVTASTIGLAALLGYEVALYLARIPADEAIRIVWAACTMLGQYGHKFRDSDTFGEDEAAERYRIRFQSEGLHGAQTDIWALLHPTFPIDDVELFGPRLLRPPPPGVQNRFRGDEGWLARLVSKVRA